MGNKKRYLSVVSIVFALLASILLVSCQKKEQAASTKIAPVDIETLKSRLVLETEENAETGAKVSRGTFAVFEDREAQEGRMIHLDVMVLHATGLEVKPDPLFVFAGGPGANVSGYDSGYARSWIREEEIVEIAVGTDMGDGRIRRQKAVCEFWPRSEIPDNYGEPVGVEVPVLLLSGNLDPVTPPRWGEEVASHMPNSLHLVAPGSHGVGNSCLRSIQKQFLETGTIEGLDTSCVETMKAGRFRIPKK